MKTHASQQIMGLRRCNFLPVAPMVMSLVFLESQCRELSKNVYFYPIRTYSFRKMILSLKTCHDTPNLSELSPPPHKVTPTTFWLKCKNLPKCTKFCSTRKLEVAAKSFGLLTKNRLMHWQMRGLKGNFCVVCLNL